MALEALGWIKHGTDFNYVCGLAGRDPNYVRNRMLNKVIQREAAILAERDRIKRGVNNIIFLKQLNPEYHQKQLTERKEKNIGQKNKILNGYQNRTNICRPVEEYVQSVRATDI